MLELLLILYQIHIHYKLVLVALELLLMLHHIHIHYTLHLVVLKLLLNLCHIHIHYNFHIIIIILITTPYMHPYQVYKYVMSIIEFTKCHIIKSCNEQYTLTKGQSMTHLKTTKIIKKMCTIFQNE